MNDSKSQKPLCVTDAARFLGYSKPYLYKLIHLGKIPCYKPTNGRVFFKQNELEQFLFRSRKSADFELTKPEENLMVSGAELLNYI